MMMLTSNPYSRLSRARLEAMIYRLAYLHGPDLIQGLIEGAHEDRSELQVRWSGMVPKDDPEAVVRVSDDIEAFWADTGRVVYMLHGEILETVEPKTRGAL